MMTGTEHHEVIVIGAGQAGLAMGAMLGSAGIDYLILGAEGRVGDVWRQRYDSLKLFTPNWLNRLPLDDSDFHPDPNAYADKDEIADYLEAYACRRQLRLRLSTQVTGLSCRDGHYQLISDRGEVTARSVVIATGPFQTPVTPGFASRLDAGVTQLHTAQYHNPGQLKPGNVLVVGCGNSGAQIALDLAGKHEVHLASGHPVSFMPQSVFGKSIFWWFDRLGVYRAHIHTRFGRRLSQQPDPVIGLELQRCLRQRIIRLHGRVLCARDNQVYFSGGRTLVVDNVIWATGFTRDYHWLNVPEVLDSDGRPLHHRGETNAKGLFFLGLPWQYSRKSALIGGVGQDAAHLLPMIQAHLNRQRAANPVIRETSALSQSFMSH